MSKASTTSVNRRRQSKLESELDNKLERLATPKRIVLIAETRRDGAIEMANKRYIEATSSALKEIEALNEEIGTFMERHYYSLVRRLSRTIARKFGTVLMVLRAKELDLPADLKPVAQLLENDEEGRQFLKPYEPQLDKAALKVAMAKGEVSPRLRAKLHGLGVWHGQHLTFLVKSPTDKNAITISRRPYNKRKRQQ